jgi:hypothetical protein
MPSTQTNFKGNLIQMSLYRHLTTSLPRQKTNLLKRGVLSLRAADREACFVPLPQCFGEGARGWGFSFADLLIAEMLSTNRIQREFLFNNCILSQNQISNSANHPKITNLFKPRHVKTPLSKWRGIGGEVSRRRYATPRLAFLLPRVPCAA